MGKDPDSSEGLLGIEAEVERGLGGLEIRRHRLALSAQLGVQFYRVRLGESVGLLLVDLCPWKHRVCR